MDENLTELDGNEIYDNWDQLMDNSAPKTQTDSIGLDGLMEGLDSDIKNQDYWVDLFQQENFAGMELMSANYYPHTINESEFHQKLEKLKHFFLKDLVAQYVNDLRSADISEESIFYMSKGILPTNWTVHLKYPLLYGGNLDMDNLVLIPIHPFHELIHKYINQQILTSAGVGHPQTLYIPVPLGKIYIPNGEMTGSGGKKKSDRSTQAGLSSANLQQIAIKTGGR